MSTFTIPNSNNQIRQVNSGDVFGELWGTFNIDLNTSQGKVLSSKRLVETLSETKMDNDDVEALVLYKGNILMFATGGRIAYIAANRNPRISASWTSSAGSVDIGQETDSVVFDGKLLVSTGTDIASTTNATGASLDTDWWTNVISGTALTVAKPHVMDVSRIGQETLFVTDGNVIRYYNTTAGHTAITLASQLTASCLATDSTSTWVGTYTSDNDAYVYEIQVGDDTPRNAYKVDGGAVLSIDIINTIPYIVTDKGHIQAFNGRGFATVASFPFADKGLVLAGLSLGDIKDDNLERAIHPKGMRANNKSLLININTNNQLIADLASNPTDNDDVFENVVVDERSPSGVWEFNVETGVLNHRYSLTDGDNTKGYHRQKSSGPILITNNQYTRLLTAGRVETDKTNVFAEDPTSLPLSFFITPEITAKTIQEAWEKVVIKTDTLASGESIEVKYRISKVNNYPKYATVNWLNSTEFVTTDTSTDFAIGHEVEIIDGYGAGKIAHITAISESTTTQTIKIDTAIGTTGETSTVRVQNWTKIDVTYDTDSGEFKVIGSDEINTWIQFKVVFNGMVKMRQFINKGNSKTEL